MYPFYEEFIQYLDLGDRAQCVELVTAKLSKNKIDMVTLYEEILGPSLKERFCRDEQREICIWEEHVRTSIVRTVIECCYLYVVSARNEKHGSASKGGAIVACPAEEYHEIGARMVADFFTLCGFDGIFIGANTPREDILEAIKYVKPKYVGISVSNSYNLVAARRTVVQIAEIRKQADLEYKIIAGGQAFVQNPCACDDAGVDLLIQTFEDLKKLPEGD